MNPNILIEANECREYSHASGESLSAHAHSNAFADLIDENHSSVVPCLFDSQYQHSPLSAHPSICTSKYYSMSACPKLI